VGGRGCLQGGQLLARVCRTRVALAHRFEQRGCSQPASGQAAQAAQLTTHQGAQAWGHDAGAPTRMGSWTASRLVTRAGIASGAGGVHGAAASVELQGFSPLAASSGLLTVMPVRQDSLGAGPGAGSSWLMAWMASVRGVGAPAAAACAPMSRACVWRGGGSSRGRQVWHPGGACGQCEERAARPQRDM
jgi:hypothetical protein